MTPTYIISLLAQAHTGIEEDKDMGPLLKANILGKLELVMAAMIGHRQRRKERDGPTAEQNEESAKRAHWATPTQDQVEGAIDWIMNWITANGMKDPGKKGENKQP
jgi:hypothetical protein